MKLKLKQALSLEDLAQLVGAHPAKDVPALDKTIITHLAVLDQATSGCVSFLSNPFYKKYLRTTEASAVILSAQDVSDYPGVALVSKNPRLSLAKLLELCYEPKTTKNGVHSTVVLGENVELGENVHIAAHCVIGANCVIGEGVILEPGVILGDSCRIGAHSQIKANVSIYHDVVIGNNCMIHSGTVIGSDGFGFALDATSGWVKMQHLGSVVIGDNVEIGSNTSIDRGMLDNTIIGNHVIIDNLVQIAHNVIIGDRTAIAGCVGIAGSAAIGKNCLIGGAACIAGHITIGDNVHITGTSAVNHSLLEPGIYSSGFPAKENSEWRRNVARFMMLDSMAKKIKELEKQMVKINE